MDQKHRPKINKKIRNKVNGIVAHICEVGLEGELFIKYMDRQSLIDTFGNDALYFETDLITLDQKWMWNEI